LTSEKSSLAESQPLSARSVRPFRVARLIIVVIGCLACVWGVWSSGREGLSQLLASYGAAAKRLDAADYAVQLGRLIPEAHYVRARLLAETGALGSSLEEYERAVALRPRDYALWLELGLAREQAFDVEGAIVAFREAVRLAPFYTAPRWQLGNTLYRAGRLEEAFAELRGAVAGDPKFATQTLELAWAAFDGDAQSVLRALQPQTTELRLALARFFVKRGKVIEALAQFRAAGGASIEERRALLADLLAARRFAEAYEVWSGGRAPIAGSSAAANALVLNGGFEDAVALKEPGFGWQLPLERASALQAAQDKAEPRSGAQSLLLNWNGNAETGAIVLSQLVLVEPNTRYQLRFAARTEKLLTGGLPFVSVTDAGSLEEPALGTAVALPTGSSPWRDYAIEFTTAKTTAAARINVRRQSCSNPVCPIFGRVWLDDFSLTRVRGAGN
jgi:hypothetical protein